MQTATNYSTFGEALDLIALLPLDAQEELIDIVQRRLIEQRRAEIAREAADTLQAVREGRASVGTAADLKRELLAELCD
jgi:hypothetical protein